MGESIYGKFLFKRLFFYLWIGQWKKDEIYIYNDINNSDNNNNKYMNNKDNKGYTNDNNYNDNISISKINSNLLRY